VNSIRVFLVAVILAVITLFYFVAALRGYQSSMQEAERLFDKQLLDTARLIATIHAEQAADDLGHDASMAFQVWRGERLLAASRNAPATGIAPREPGFDFANFSGYRWRTAAHFDGGSGNWILVADRTDLRFALAENVILESLFPTLAGLPVVGLLIWLIVSAGLRPLRALARELSSKQPADLSPLAIAAPKQELEQIVTSCNGLLQRLETSLLREKQFASDAAHELRTPISALKVQVYNLAQERSADTGSLVELERTAERLEHIVEQILDLYRSSPDQFNASFESLDLSALAREVMAEEFAAFDRKGQQLEFQGQPCTIAGDRFALTTLLRNLLSNANKYTPSGGQVLVTIDQQEDRVRLTVEDSGPGIPEDQRASIFERFYRIGRDRHPSGETGCGLGLAIVKRLVDLHRGRISITPSTFVSGSAFHVDLPRMRRGGAAGHSGKASKRLAEGAAVLLSLAVTATARAAPPVVEIEIRDHLFFPPEVVIPANTKVKLLVKNLDPTPEEFESYELNREKVISGNSQTVIFIGPLPPGEYPFFGEFYPKTAQGKVRVE
jgi:two-component system sensor histidine kinase QseC